MEWCIKLSVFVLSVLALSSADMCKDSPNPLSCHGARVVREALRQLAPAEGADVMRLADGIEVVEIAPASARANGARSLPQDDTLLGRLARYLESHELKIRLNNLMPSPQFRELLAATYKDLEQDKTIGEARKKDKGGNGAIMMMGLMMAKMIAALGFGGIGTIALKALGVATLALMLSAIIGIRSLTGSSHDEGHHVSYVSLPHHGEHHRRRRDLEEQANAFAYRGWRPQNHPKNTHNAPRTE